MSDDTGPVEAGAEAPEPPVPPASPGQGQPAYALPYPPGYPAYAGGQPLPGMQQQRPRFADQVMGMRAVVATALACLIVGGFGGYALGRATGNGDSRMMRGPGMFQQRGAFPGTPQGNGYGSGGFAPRFDGTPQRRFGGTPSPGAVPGGPPSPTPSQGSGQSGN